MADLESLLWEAATIMLTGMFVVFIFLSILIFLVQLLAKVAPVDALPAAQKPQPSVASHHNEVQPDVIAAISSAVYQYRQRKA